jgi:outer membrane protein OmpA-like peptidoglycan-associated protein
MNKAPLQFSIPKPCRESFADMPQSGEGRFCGKCETVIYDFSQMTDAELIRFFEAKPETHCGRFHNSQLNRVIKPVTIRNNFFRKFTKIAASIIAILTLRSAPAKAQGEMRPLLAQNPQVTKKPVSTSQEVLLIKGTVKDGEGKPLKDAVVKFDELKETTTDENGAYSFELSNINEPHNIYFDLSDYVRTVRNFHPVMGNSIFDVVLIKRDPSKFHSGFSGGVVAYNQLGDLPSLTFKGENYKLTPDMKALLATVAAKMKATPDRNIEVLAYPGGHIKQTVFTKRLELIKAYLVDQHGISQNRINIRNEAGGGDIQTVDIKATY